MLSLHELQREVSRYLLGGGGETAARFVLPDRIDPSRRLQIYRNHFRISLNEALAATFPVTARLVGPGYFAAATRRFVDRHPPAAPVLAEYGARFPAFVAALPHAPVYLGDVARLEWAINESATAPDVAPIGSKSLRIILQAGFGETALTPHPATRLVVSPFPIDCIWKANQPSAPEAFISLDQGGVALLLWRRDAEVEFRPLPAAEHRFVAALMDGESLGSAAAAALDEDPVFELTAALTTLLSDPIFADPTV